MLAVKWGKSAEIVENSTNLSAKFVYYFLDHEAQYVLYSQ